MLVRRTVFERCGPPDAGLFMYFEDVDWCLRGRRAGCAALWCPALRCVIMFGAFAAAVWVFYKGDLCTT